MIDLRTRLDALTDDERMVLDAARAYCQRDPELRRVRALRDQRPSHDPQAWAELAEMGWLGGRLPEAYGGIALTHTQTSLLLEEFGGSLAPEPLTAAAVLAAGVLVRADNEALKAHWLPRLAAGTWLPALAWQDPSGAAEAGQRTRATRRDGGYVLDGRKVFVPNGESADAFVVAAQTGQDVGLYWVPRTQAGVSVTAEPCADGTASAWVVLDGVKVAPEHCLAPPADGGALLRSAVDLGTIACSAELVGGMDRALELTLDYLRTRKQFGKPIGSFQALQHRAVDLWIHRQVTRAVVDAAIRAFDSPASDARARTLAASSAKARAAQSALLLSNQTIQLHGAIGTTDEYDLGLYVNRALTLSAWMGNASEHRRRFGALTASSAKVNA